MRAMTWKVTGALAMGCTIGWIGSSAAGCGAARADGEAKLITLACTMTAQATPSQTFYYAQYDAAGRTAADLLLSVRRVRVDDSAAAPNPTGSYIYDEDDFISGIPPAHFTDGKVVFHCGQTANQSIVVAVR